MAEKAPCRWLKPITDSFDGTSHLGACKHPMVLKFIGKTGTIIVVENACHGCPCHDPAPEEAESQTGRPGPLVALRCLAEDAEDLIQSLGRPDSEEMIRVKLSLCNARNELEVNGTPEPDHIRDATKMVPPTESGEFRQIHDKP